MGKIGTIVKAGLAFGVRDGMLRLSYELRRGSGLLDRRMRMASGWDSWSLDRIAPGVSAERLLSTRRDGARPFFFSDARTLAEAVRTVIGADGERRALAEGEDVLAGRLRFFGQLSFACGLPPDWFRNPATGQKVSPDRRWTTMRFADAEYGDLKFVLEPSRFLFIYPLARAYALSGEERFAEGFWCAFEDWTAKSAAMTGPLWVCGQESSLRILAWTFALYAFVGAAATTPNRVARLVSAITAHAWRAEQTIGYARSQRSNHLFSEAVALWTTGTLYPELKDAARWQRRGRELLQDSVLDQITAEGEHLQYSFNYQRMVLQLLLWTIRLAEIHHVALPAALETRAEAGLDLISKFVDPESGSAPNYGSNDGCLILPLSLCGYGDFRPLVREGDAVLGRKSPLGPGLWDEAAVWLGRAGIEKARENGGISRDPIAGSGYHRLGGRTSWALVRAGRYRRRPFQADQLHVDLWWRGLNLALDPGTYLYNGDPPWDNGLAGTAVHNTVVVDGRDQMQRAGRFLWLDWAQASGKASALRSGGPADCFEGEHNGYKKLGIRHRRKVVCVAEDAWVIVDDMVGEGEHDVRLHWLVPDFPSKIRSGSPLKAEFQSSQGAIHWNVFASSPGSSSIVRAGTRQGSDAADPAEPVLGWKSPTYGELRPAVSMVYRTRARLPLRMISVMLAGYELRLESNSAEVVIWKMGERIYQATVAPERA